MDKLNESIYSLYKKWSEGTVRKEDVHEYVDLGLPSGNLWATMNIGANDVNDPGEYFAFGETKPKDKYLISNYNAYDSDILDEKHDAASVNWGDQWRTPSEKDFKELIKYTVCVLNGDNAFVLVSKINRNKICVPCGGYMDHVMVLGDYGVHLMTNSNSGIVKELVKIAEIDSKGDVTKRPYFFNYNAFMGYNIRPVRNGKNK